MCWVGGAAALQALVSFVKWRGGGGCVERGYFDI